jgi:tRNA (cytidine/uridine-2'-O-)-methyltransferase
MFHVVLHEPEIPPNTGNLMRLTVNVGAELHLVHPLGFDVDDTRMRRAGLDYREHSRVRHHETFDACVDELTGRRVFAFSQHADRLYTDIAYRPGDVLLFGKESVGLPESVRDHRAVTEQVRIPIAAMGRSLNLANAAAVGIYEAWRQNGFTEVAAVE